MISRKSLFAALGALLLLTACGPASDTSKAPAGPPKEITFSILSAENEASMAPLWQPLLDDMQKATGVKVKAFYATNYTSLIEAMRFNQVQMGWFSALPALEATRRAKGEVIGRIIDAGGEATYTSVLIVRKGSGITLDDVLKCGKRYNFGIGDAKSTSGTLAPMAYLFSPKGIDPTVCFKTVRSANHQANLFAVANGVQDIATNNSVGLVFAGRENPAARAKVEVIWTSPPLPESSIVLRTDLDPALKEKIRQFFITYGTQAGPDGDRQRQILKGLAYGGFRAADNTYLDPIRVMEAAEALSNARRGGDAAKIKAAEANYQRTKEQADLHASQNQ